jgi:hypothetical protein
MGGTKATVSININHRSRVAASYVRWSKIEFSSPFAYLPSLKSLHLEDASRPALLVK